ncbi:MAG TPA: calcium-binding protein [Gaiellaceae bacterium]
MKKLVRPTAFAAVAVLAAIVAGQATAAPATPAYKSPPHYKGPKFKEPKLKHGLLKIKGTNEDDKITLRLKTGDPGTLEVDVGDDGSADFSFRRAYVERIDVKARGGDDLVRIDESNGVFTDTIQTKLDGGNGIDNLIGGSGVETFLGGGGNDSMDGNRGNDIARMGAGEDTFIWDPGDGNDTIEGQQGNDTMRFNGANVAETVDVSANGHRLRFFRQPGNVLMDTNEVERVDFNALGAADVVNVNDLAGTDVTAVNVDLASTLGGTAGDGAADQVIVNGSNGNDNITVNADASVSGLQALVAIQHPEAADKLTVNGLGGNDSISAAALATQLIGLTLDGGRGNDTLAGSQVLETLLGEDGNDSIDGNRGNDTAFMGSGDDTFTWDPGDGNDRIEGQDGNDRMRFNGANVAEQVDVSANGPRLRFFRQPGNVLMDTDDVERVDFNALGAADVITVNNLAGTDVNAVNLDLAGTLGGNAGDGAADQIIVKASDGDDTISVSGDTATGVRVSGLAATVGILHSEAADRLDINTLLGNDTVNAGGLAAGAIQLFVDGVAVP